MVVQKGIYIMKLNYDCVRDFLIDIEKSVDISDNISVSAIMEHLPDYSAEDVIYTALQLTEAGYINANNIVGNVNNAGFVPKYYVISSMTFSGHEYLNSIRDNKVWSAVKKEISTLSTVSLPVIQRIAQQFILNQLHL